MASHYGGGVPPVISFKSGVRVLVVPGTLQIRYSSVPPSAGIGQARLVFLFPVDFVLAPERTFPSLDAGCELSPEWTLYP